MTNRQLHLKTIRNHRKYVKSMCFKMGIPFQGLVHDLSKYSPTEMKIAKWANGKRSPHDNARDELGYSPSWYHHMHSNKHHWEYWCAYNSAIGINGKLYLSPEVIKIPYKYIIEMFCDFVGAGKAYSQEKWTPSTPLMYWKEKCEGKRIMYPQSQKLLVYLLEELNLLGEKEFIRFYKKNKKTIKAKYERNK